MNLELLVAEHLWLTLLIWLAAYAGDYYLTVVGARRFRAAHPDAVGKDSYELTPGMEDDVDHLRWISRKFLVMLGGSGLFFTALWFLAARAVLPRSAFLFLYGTLLLRQLPILVRHARNLAFYADGTATSRPPRWIVLRASGVELVGWASAYLFLWGLTGSWVILGGVGGPLLAGHDQWRLASRARRATEVGRVAVDH